MVGRIILGASGVGEGTQASAIPLPDVFVGEALSLEELLDGPSEACIEICGIRKASRCGYNSSSCVQAQNAEIDAI